MEYKQHVNKKRTLILAVGIPALIFMGCVLAPLMKRLFISLAPNYSFFDTLARYELYRILSRILMVLTLIYLIGFRKTLFSGSDTSGLLKVSSLSARLFVAGFMLGIATLLIQVGCAVFFGARTLFFYKFTWAKFVAKSVKAFFSASLIGLIEEFVFRGILFGYFKRHLPLIMAFLLSSLIYSAAHFFQPKDMIPIDETSLLSGFVIFAHIIKPVLSPEVIMRSIGLVLVGLCLASGYYFTRSLYFSIGLHAGWVFVIKVDGIMVTRTMPDRIFLWGSSNIVGGISTWIMLVAVLFIIPYLITPYFEKRYGISKISV